MGLGTHFSFLCFGSTTVDQIIYTYKNHTIQEELNYNLKYLVVVVVISLSRVEEHKPEKSMHTYLPRFTPADILDIRSRSMQSNVHIEL